jgi:hypothetical protein
LSPGVRTIRSVIPPWPIELTIGNLNTLREGALLFTFRISQPPFDLDRLLAVVSHLANRDMNVQAILQRTTLVRKSVSLRVPTRHDLRPPARYSHHLARP